MSTTQGCGKYMKKEVKCEVKEVKQEVKEEYVEYYDEVVKSEEIKKEIKKEDIENDKKVNTLEDNIDSAVEIGCLVLAGTISVGTCTDILVFSVSYNNI